MLGTTYKSFLGLVSQVVILSRENQASGSPLAGGSVIESCQREAAHVFAQDCWTVL